MGKTMTYKEQAKELLTCNCPPRPNDLVMVDCTCTKRLAKVLEDTFKAGRAIGRKDNA